MPGSPAAPCDSTRLVSGAVVGEAELDIGSSGLEFSSLDLVR